MSISNFRIGTRLGGGFAAVLCLTALIAGVGTWRLGSTADEAARMMEAPMAKDRLAQEWFRNVNVGVRRTAAIARSSDPQRGNLLLRRGEGFHGARRGNHQVDRRLAHQR